MPYMGNKLPKMWSPIQAHHRAKRRFLPTMCIHQGTKACLTIGCVCSFLYITVQHFIIMFNTIILKFKYCYNKNRASTQTAIILKEQYEMAMTVGQLFWLQVLNLGETWESCMMRVTVH